MDRPILVTGALGQIGSALVPALRKRHGRDAVVASDIRVPGRTPGRAASPAGDGPFEPMDCTNPRAVDDAIRRHGIGTVYHLAALLSATAEERPQAAWHVNMDSLHALLDAARRYRCALFFPSSIGAFGPTTPRDATPQDTIQRPTTIYGVTKVSGELLCDYYAHRFGLDVRGLRFPGLISHDALPGGGTTDYAVDIFYHALRYGRYVCPLAPDTRLDMMYMPDAIRAMIELMEADPAKLVHRNAFNLAAINLTPDELAAAIRKRMPSFTIEYDVDPALQEIADSWPRSVDDGAARAEWGWAPQYDLDAMTGEMLDRLGARIGRGA